MPHEFQSQRWKPKRDEARVCLVHLENESPPFCEERLNALLNWLAELGQSFADVLQQCGEIAKLRMFRGFCRNKINGPLPGESSGAVAGRMGFHIETGETAGKVVFQTGQEIESLHQRS